VLSVLDVPEEDWPFANKSEFEDLDDYFNEVRKEKREKGQQISTTADNEKEEEGEKEQAEYGVFDEKRT
jgi:hypothetical protein